MQYEYEREEDVETSHFGRICLAIFGLLLGIPAMLFALFVFACLAIRFESEWEDQRRQRLAHEVLQLGYAARDDPSDSRAAKKLLAMANGDEFYDASKATNAMGLMGEAARPHIPQIAILLRHEDRWVRMEAVRTLEKLGPVSAEALPDLVSYLDRCDSTSTSFEETVDAIARIGQPSVAACRNSARVSDVAMNLRIECSTGQSLIWKHCSTAIRWQRMTTVVVVVNRMLRSETNRVQGKRNGSPILILS